MWLTDAQAQAIIQHARVDAPNEACGLLVGRQNRVSEIIHIPNNAADPQHHYHMDEKALVTALSRLETRGLELLGIYHSHPAGDPIPSQTDIRQATYSDTPYLIIGLKNGTASLAAWKMRAGQVDAVPLHIGDMPPPETPALSSAQKTAILLSALIAFALLIVVSLSLLPPAPLIPR
jgi:proteasome lid subunit RPN8/RPN11